jgi:hypothetical protein
MSTPDEMIAVIELAEKQFQNIGIYLLKKGILLDAVQYSENGRPHLMFRQVRITEGVDASGLTEHPPGHG